MKTNLENLNYEFILVNDGSPDDTWQVIKNIIDDHTDIKIKGINYSRNSGKGYAVRTGMSYANGENVLMLDADGATSTKEISAFIKKIQSQNNNDKVIIIGSRNLEEQVVENRPWYRKIPSLVNNFIVTELLGVKGIKDTQCGFKMFTKRAIRDLFPKMHLNRWAFDVELLYLAQR